MNQVQVSQCWSQRQQQPVSDRLPRWVRWRINKSCAKWIGIPRKREARLFWGQPMTIVYPEFVSSKIGRHGYFENDMTSMLIDVLRPGMTVYDVGSHYGYFSMLASELVGDHGRVFAFEPTPRTYQVLCENAARRPNIIGNNLAAFRQSGELTFVDQGLNNSALNHIVAPEVGQDEAGQDETESSGTVTVKAVRLDDFASEHGDPDFVKIDAEGAERPILEGMAEIIERSRPGISLEMSDQVCERTGNRPCRENIEFLMDLGYDVFDYRQLQPVPHHVASTYIYDNLFFRHPNWRFLSKHKNAA